MNKNVVKIFFQDRLWVSEYSGSYEMLVFIFPPLLEEYPRSRKLLINFQEYLLHHGISSIRWDYSGTGYSSGSHREFNFESVHRDYIQLLNHYRKMFHPKKIAILGVRFGAYLTLSIQKKSGEQFPTILWSPVLNPWNYWKQLLREEIANQMFIYGKIRENKEALENKLKNGEPITIMGYEISPDLYSQWHHALPITPDDYPSPHPLIVINWETKSSISQQNPQVHFIQLNEKILFSFSHIRYMQFTNQILYEKTLEKILSL